jgi:aminoglycoside 6'-N-acetyltransferase
MEAIIKSHNITLTIDELTLRPMTDDDFDVLLKWNSDPDVLYFSEGDDVEKYSLEDVQGIYGYVSKMAFTFIIERHGQPIGECWLQEMNIDHVLEKYPNKDLRRIDLVIGEKGLWGKGIGTRVIERLVKFGFENENADIIFYMPSDYNPRSIKAAEKVGFSLKYKVRDNDSTKGEYTLIMAMCKGEYKYTTSTPRTL